MAKFSKELTEILNSKIVGNHYSDKHIFDLVGDFVLASNNLEEQKEALRFLHEDVMGLDPVEITEEMVERAEAAHFEYINGYSPYVQG